MASVGSSGLQAFDDIASMLQRTVFRRKLSGRLLQPVGKICLKPVPAFLADTEIAGGSGLADMGTDTVKEGSHADRGEITFYDRQGGDITSLYNLSGGGFQ